MHPADREFKRIRPTGSSSAQIDLCIFFLLLCLFSCRHRDEIQSQPDERESRDESEFTVAATGDSILIRPIQSSQQDRSFEQVVGLIRSASVSMTNLELTLLDPSRPPVPPGAEAGGMWLYAEPRVADDLKWMGFDLISRANNHSTDFGIEGMLQTDTILDQKGLAHAGTGRDLASARSAAFVQNQGRRITLLSTATSHTLMSRGGEPRKDMIGRPGLSFLRLHQIMYLSQPEFDALRNIANLVAARPVGISPSETSMMFAGISIKRADRSRSVWEADSRDAYGLLSEIKKARETSDVIIVAVHSHEPTNESPVPADVLPRLAREMIENGADVVAVTGPHQLRGIEIYKSRPIFYSLGNFFFQYRFVKAQPSDLYDAYRLDNSRAEIDDLFTAFKGTALEFAGEKWWLSCVAIIRFSGRKLIGIELHPIDLGVTLPVMKRGLPRIPNATAADKVISRLALLSEPFGTKILNRNSKGFIVLP